MTSAALTTAKKEVEKWVDSGEETALTELRKAEGNTLHFVIGEDEYKFSVSISKDYPKSKELVVSSESAKLASWVKTMNEYAAGGKRALGDVLTYAAEKFLADVVGDTGDAEDEGDDMFVDDGIDTRAHAKPKKSKEEQEIDDKDFLPIGSPAATMRLLTDLKNIAKGNPKELGFSAAPVKDAKSGLENLYHWHVKLVDFDGHLAQDLQAYKKKTGQDHVLLELKFSKDYPFVPPFVRVVKPRFAFRTGHITLGGSICMELLTLSGWNSTNDIESILIQIRAEINSGGARLDAGANGSYEYTEHEAWEAFNRAASTHGWSIKGLNAQTYQH